MGLEQSIYDGADVETLMLEANKIINQVTNLVTSTTEIVLSYTENLDKRANNQMKVAFININNFLNDLAYQGEIAENCVSEIREKLKKKKILLTEDLATCYRVHTTKLDNIKTKRAQLNIQARKLKTDIEEMMSDCINRPNINECLSNGLNNYQHKVVKLSKNVKKLTFKEFNTRKKTVLYFLDCDKKAIHRAYTESQRIVTQIKKCLEENNFQEDE